MSGVSKCLILLIIYGAFHCAQSLDCPQSSNALKQLISRRSCPSTFGDSDDIFCCINDDVYYCCDFDTFVRSSWLLYIAVSVLVGLLFVCCMCCCFCPCCMLYKRRHRGTVYGRVQQPSAVVNVHSYGSAPMQPATMSMPMPQTASIPPGHSGAPLYPTYPVVPDYAGAAQQPPPPYSTVTKEGYATQSPYNPSYSHQ